jgi:pimeloyl-ACP methyl ester carboxylesterase
MFETKLITTPTDTKLYSESFGSCKNPAILLIAGSMAPARFWIDDFCEELAAQNYFVIRYDNRDIGLSSSIDYAKHPYTLKDLANDAICILDAYKITQAHIIGHSMGGSIAQTIALDYQRRVLSLTLISSSILAIASVHMQEVLAIGKILHVIMRNKFTKSLAESVDSFMNIFQHLHGDVAMEQDIARDYITDIYERSNPAHMKWFDKYSRGREPLHNHFRAQILFKSRIDELKKLHVPTMLIHGEKDTLIPARIADKYIAQIIPNAHMHVMPGMGHMILNYALFMHIKDLVLANLSTRNT